MQLILDNQFSCDKINFLSSSGNHAVISRQVMEVASFCRPVIVIEETNCLDCLFIQLRCP